MASADLAEDLDEFMMLRALAAGGKNVFFD
jgi:hypothetical protein